MVERLAMNIVYASDEGYCPHMAVSIASLIEHNQSEQLTFHILSDGISMETEDALRSMVQRAGKRITFYPIEHLMEALRGQIADLDTGRFRITTLARLLMGSVLPRMVTKVLYLDCDTVVLRSLAPLYRLHLGDCIAAMAAEPTIYPEVKAQLGLTEEDCYYNAGMMLLNLSAWRMEDLEAMCFAYYNQMGGRLPFNDQDVLNHVLQGRIRRVGQRYNFISNYYYYRYATLCGKSASFASGESKESFHVAKHHPVIVHFATDERPWNRGSRNHYRRAYSVYRKQTPFAAVPLVKGKELYMVLYHGMNIVTFLCPALRQLISDRYYHDKIEE